MRAAKKVARILVSIPALLLVLLCVSCAETKGPSPTIKVGAGVSAGIYDDLARTLARIVNEHQASTGIRLESVSSIGSVANINAIAAGDVQFGAGFGIG